MVRTDDHDDWPRGQDEPRKPAVFLVGLVVIVDSDFVPHPHQNDAILGKVVHAGRHHCAPVQGGVEYRQRFLQGDIGDSLTGSSINSVLIYISSKIRELHNFGTKV